MLERLNRSIVKPVALVALIVASLATSAVAAQTPPPINEEPHIHKTLFAAAVGALILQSCSTVFPRYLRIKTKIDELEAYAHDMGYTDEDIRGFLDDKDEQKKMRRAANRYLRKHGVVKGNPETYCALGRAEIANKTLTGQVIWSLK